jgi:hypothetical protein
VTHTCMNIAALSVKVIKSPKNLLNNKLRDREGKSFVWLPQSEVHQSGAQDVRNEADVASCRTS